MKLMNKVCSFCGKANSAEAKKCINCKRPMEYREKLD